MIAEYNSNSHTIVVEKHPLVVRPVYYMYAHVAFTPCGNAWGNAAAAQQAGAAEVSLKTALQHSGNTAAQLQQYTSTAHAATACRQAF